MELLINMVLLTLLALITIGIIRVRNLFAVVVLAGAYSFLMASVMMVLDAVDVAMTEAAVGAGISTVLMLATLGLVGREESAPRGRGWLPLAVVLVTGGALVFATQDMPRFADPDAPIHRHVAPRYIEDSPRETGVPNMVTSVLASYRGYDTLGETVVIFTAGIGVLLLLGGRRRGGDDGDDS